jgi:DNA repair protein RadC
MKALKNPDVMERLSHSPRLLTTEELISVLTDIDPEVFKEAQESVLAIDEGLQVRETMELATYGELPSKKLTKLQMVKFKALAELIRQVGQKQSKQIKVIHGPEDVANYLMPLLKYETKEHFVVMFLNTKNHVIGHKIISTGSLSASVVHPREVFEAACKAHAAAIIVSHNHPSGDPTPSREDKAVTERLVKAGNVMDIPVLDHVIIGNARYCSFKDKGLL